MTFVIQYSGLMISFVYLRMIGSKAIRRIGGTHTATLEIITLKISKFQNMTSLNEDSGN